MADNKRTNLTTAGWLLIGIAIVGIVIAIIIFIIFNGRTTDELVLSGSRSVSGLKCTDRTHTNLIVQESSPISHTNTITATFMDEKLSSITFEYKGEYPDPSTADHARDLAESAYNTTMTNKYGLDITDFTHNISVNDSKVHASITADNTKNLSSKTAPLFMLSDTQTFPSTLRTMESAYKNLGFTCEIKN